MALEVRPGEMVAGRNLVATKIWRRGQKSIDSVPAIREARMDRGATTEAQQLREAADSRVRRMDGANLLYHDLVAHPAIAL